MGSIPEETIEQVAAANDIADVIGSYFPLKRAGANFKALCPFHQEKTPSFHVSPARQTFHCFGCGVGGSVFRFVMEYEHIDFPAAVRRLGARAGIPIVEERFSTAEGDRQHETRALLLRLHAEAAEWFHHHLMKAEAGAAARQYLKGRGIDGRVAKAWQLGFAPDSWEAFLKWAREKGYRREHLRQSGLVKLRDEDRPEGELYDRFRGRIMFPICNDIGEVVAFSGRVLEKEAEGAKYLNSPETPLFRKGNILFGLHRTKRGLIEAGCAIVCEGQLDLISLFEAGFTNVVAPQGTAFTEAQARVLKRYVNEVVLCFDSDSAGQKAAERSLDALLQNDLVIRVATMPPGEDPDSLVRNKGRDAFAERISAARDFFEHWIERETEGENTHSLVARTKLARRLAEMVGRIQDTFLRGEVAGRASAQLGLPLREFEKLVPRDNTRRAERADRAEPAEPAPAPSHEIAMICLLALRHREARDFLLAQDWRELLAQTPGSELLQRILEGSFDPAEPSSLNVFMAGLPPAEESIMAGWLLRPMPTNPLAVAEGWWRGLQQSALRRQLQVAEHRMKLPQLTPGEVVNLQKQILDLQKQLRELAQLSSPRIVDH